MSEPEQPRMVLVVEDDLSLRRLVRMALEVEGVEVREAATLGEARAALADDPDVVVLDLHLPDGDGLTLAHELRSTAAHVAVVVHSTEPDEATAAGFAVVAKGDVDRLVAAVSDGPTHPPDQPMGTCILAEEEAGVVADWEELCRWDPLLPPDTEPPDGASIVRVLAAGVARPQPIAWGPDADLERAVERFADAVGSPDLVIEELVCLREAASRRLRSRLPGSESTEVLSRLHVLVDRAIGVAAHRALTRLEQEALTDPLTGLGNRRALERDLRTATARSVRYQRRLTIVMCDLVGLKTVNDREGHGAGDRLIVAFADALRRVLRRGDTAYRLGGDEFAVLLQETPADGAAPVMDRVAEGGAPAFTWGCACFPDDCDAPRLLDVADARLYQRRRGERRETAS